MDRRFRAFANFQSNRSSKINLSTISYYYVVICFIFHITNEPYTPTLGELHLCFALSEECVFFPKHVIKEKYLYT